MYIQCVYIYSTYCFTAGHAYMILAQLDIITKELKHYTDHLCIRSMEVWSPRLITFL